MSSAVIDGKIVISPQSDGWCGETCPGCKGEQYVENDQGYQRACGRCGGTGERYEAMLDFREVRSD